MKRANFEVDIVKAIYIFVYSLHRDISYMI